MSVQWELAQARMRIRADDGYSWDVTPTQVCSVFVGTVRDHAPLQDGLL